jgi:predicted DNA-binding transcriptional regulator YafY
MRFKMYLYQKHSMPRTKNALIRYQALDRCFSNPARKFYIDDLLEYCNTALFNYDAALDGIRKRQLFDDIKFMESVHGWSIPLERVKDGKKMFYRYVDPSFSISNEPINVLEAEQIKAALLVFQRIKGLPQFKWMHALVLKLEKEFQLQTTNRAFISFDNNEYLKGIEYLGALFNAIVYKRVLNIKYQSFRSIETKTLHVNPYYLKQFNNRWFLFGKSPEFTTLTNLALDRIISLEETALTYEETSLNFEEYFEDVVGVTVPEAAEFIQIKLRVSDALAPYIRTKPIHGSQKELSPISGENIFAIEVLPNYELEKLLLALGEDIEITEPVLFREKFKRRVAALYRLYH